MGRLHARLDRLGGGAASRSSSGSTATGGVARAGSRRRCVDGGAQRGGVEARDRTGAGQGRLVAGAAGGAGGRGDLAGAGGPGGRAGQRLAGQAVGAGVDQHRPLAHEPRQRDGLGPGYAEGIGRRRTRTARPARRSRTAARARGRAGSPTGPRPRWRRRAARPGRRRAASRRAGRGLRRRRRRRAARPGSASARRQARVSPACSSSRRPQATSDTGSAVGGPAERAVQRVGERGADQAERVARGFVGGAEQAGIVGRVGPEQGPGQHAEGDQHEADEFGSAAAQRLLGVAFHQRAAAFALGALSHVGQTLSVECGAPSVARMAPSPRATSSSPATSATRM